MKRLGVKPRPTGLPEGYEWTDERRAAHRAAIDRPEWRARNRENLMKRLPTMRGPSANSPLEKLLQAALMKAGLSFRRSASCWAGTAWTSFFSRPRSSSRPTARFTTCARSRTRNGTRHSPRLATGSSGSTAPGSTAAPMRCVAEVIEACGLTPDTDPVADIRTGMMGPENPNWTRRPPDGHLRAVRRRDPAERLPAQAEEAILQRKCYGAWLTDHPEAEQPGTQGRLVTLPALYAGGMTMKELASHYGCSLQTIDRAMAGWASRPGRAAAVVAPPQ